MPDDNTTNLPILDDIIKPGNTDKATHLPSNKMQNSMRPDDGTGESSSADHVTETDSDPAVDEHATIPELSTDINKETPMYNEQIQQDAPVETAEARQPSIDLPDIDTLTEEILGSMMFEMEQMLREKIRQTLKKKFSGDIGSD